MHVLAVRRPGQKGTRRLSEQYGTRLVCVRYRYDANAKKRYKTIELIVEEAGWQPPPQPDSLSAPPPRPIRRVGVRVGFHEKELRQRVKAAGGTWSADERLWRVSHDRAIALGLEARIVKR